MQNEDASDDVLPVPGGNLSWKLAFLAYSPEIHSKVPQSRAYREEVGEDYCNVVFRRKEKIWAVHQRGSESVGEKRLPYACGRQRQPLLRQPVEDGRVHRGNCCQDSRLQSRACF